MYTRKKRRPVAEINVVPYIDVMLVLLVIFMITTPIITQGVKVELPKSAAEPIEQMKDGKTPLVATVDEAGLYYFEKDGNQQGPFTASQLQVEVASWLSIEPGTQVIVKGDGRVDYNSVIRLINVLKQAGAPSVGLMTDNEV
ncbi:MAG: protein TolR [Alishewanella agri]|mgnify:FL=1|jgi:biopolymer transport protein TolR|uniref:Tol-Pal system protein TolR n=1 Tax=Alishewanella agri BL06 TaxID=1195246 RepID=I9DTI5_9ALTE|nr:MULTISPECIES: protein TolR [Alishewanella]EIW89440.1 protein TolR [Alishewanella agri BL06]KRS22116.1 biopolymer transporter ExbD [Alishewanella sp. WH16-1]MDD4864548.1 protein TolR [Alishewanella agri]OZB42620.1 MAG: protein TolR [Alishewanella sp. 34-51-39]